ncbi:hypothetical protein TNCT_521291 [Trichonephila clavata]|uniref:Uncharacterized protein n=1 Tax=Trichonephila clavata TaxID=2740835 RepID=A0A8X6H430_TRICU|nr:hypothetical protein TNCT_521291 [Trichonephila clavata]
MGEALIAFPDQLLGRDRFYRSGGTGIETPPRRVLDTFMKVALKRAIITRKEMESLGCDFANMKKYVMKCCDFSVRSLDKL